MSKRNSARDALIDADVLRAATECGATENETRAAADALLAITPILIQVLDAAMVRRKCVMDGPATRRASRMLAVTLIALADHA